MKGIVRVKKTTDFVVMDKTALQDERLSWKAKGLIAYLLSKPDDWSVYVAHLLKQSPDGRDAVYSGLKELEQAGYLVRTRRHDAQGRFRGVEYLIYERPVTPSDPSHSPCPENPDTDETRATAANSPRPENPDMVPYPEKPYTENPDTATKYRSQSFTKNDFKAAAVAVRTRAREQDGVQSPDAPVQMARKAVSLKDNPPAISGAPGHTAAATGTSATQVAGGSQCSVAAPDTSLPSSDSGADDQDAQAGPASLPSVASAGLGSPLTAIEQAFCDLTGRKQATTRDLQDMQEALTLTGGDVELIVQTMVGRNEAFRPGYPSERIQSFAYFLPAIVEAVSRRSHYARSCTTKYGVRSGIRHRRQSYNDVLDRPSNSGPGTSRILHRRQSYDDLIIR